MVRKKLKKQKNCDITCDLTKIDPKRIIFVFWFDNFELAEKFWSLEEDEEENKKDWLEATGLCSILIADKPIEDDEIDEFDLDDAKKIANFHFDMNKISIKFPEDMNDVEISDDFKGIGIGSVIKDFESNHEVKFIDHEIETLILHGKDTPSVTTLNQRYVG